MTIGLALSGGGSKGDFELGAVRFLYDSGIQPSVISGCSVGAINAAKLAEGEDPADATRGLPGLEAIWSSLQTNSDMYSESAWLAGLPAEIKAAIEGQVPISSLGPTTIPVAYFPDVSQIRQAFINLAYLTSTGKDILETLQSALTQATSLFTLEPIRAKLNADLDPAKVAAWAAQGNKLRLGMVALENGSLRYVTEGAALVERDGATAVMAPPVNACAPERQAVTAAENALRNAQQQLFAPNANRQAELRNVREASEALSQAQHALAACQNTAPTAPIAVKTDLTTAVLASAAFPGFFPPVPIADETYVDGGVRALIPIDGAIRAGATEVYAVSASPIPPDPAGGQWLMLDIAWRAVDSLKARSLLSTQRRATRM
jgi:NTE family protein